MPSANLCEPPLPLLLTRQLGIIISSTHRCDRWHSFRVRASHFLFACLCLTKWSSFTGTYAVLAALLAVVSNRCFRLLDSPVGILIATVFWLFAAWALVCFAQQPFSCGPEIHMAYIFYLSWIGLMLLGFVAAGPMRLIPEEKAVRMLKRDKTAAEIRAELEAGDPALQPGHHGGQVWGPSYEKTLREYLQQLESRSN